MSSNALIDAKPPLLPTNLQVGGANRTGDDILAAEEDATSAPAAAATAVCSAPVAGKKQPHDTVEGCRVLAIDDLARAADADTLHGRLKLEHSAATWAERGNMLQSLATRRDRRSAADPA